MLLYENYEAGKVDNKTVQGFKDRLSGFYKDYDGELDAKSNR